MNDPLSMAFIDGANFWQSCSRDGLNFQIDYKRLGRWLTANFNCVRLNYYTAVVEGENQHQQLRPLLDWLNYNGYNVIEKMARPKGVNAEGKQLYKGNMDIEIAVDCCRLMALSDIRRVILFTGDSDFVKVVQYMQEHGAHVTVVSTRRTTPSFLAEDLRKAADAYIDIAEIQELIEKDKPNEESRSTEQTAGAIAQEQDVRPRSPFSQHGV